MNFAEISNLDDLTTWTGAGNNAKPILEMDYERSR